MKTTILTTFATLFFITTQGQSTGCNTAVPGWGNSLGKVEHGVERTISGNGITQTWSEPLSASGCDKSEFNGGTGGDYNADCRSNPDQAGDLFSWCAVARFKEQLCPTPWRVPTQADWFNLDKALGGTGGDGIGHIDNYLNTWGGAYPGFCMPDGRLGAQGAFALYWAQTEKDADEGHKVHLYSSGHIYTTHGYSKDAGFTVRCVK